MIHVVLLKFKENCLNENFILEARKLYKDLEQLDYVISANLFENCVERDSNYDIMLKIQLDNKDFLQKYLDHELHTIFLNYIKENIVGKVTFDYVV